MRIIEGGDVAWGAVAFGEQNPININYFRNQLQHVANNLTDQAKNFYTISQQMAEKFTNSDAVKTIRNALKNAATLFQTDVIKTLYEIEDLETASLRMQRWIMSNPYVRKMYQDQKCDGYSDTYVDIYPTAIGENHYDYRRVMDGVVVVDEETGEDSFKIYYEDLVEGDRDLLTHEKLDILTTWEIIEMFMKKGAQDPTSQYGASL